MANPQKENGFTGLSHELLQAIMRYPFNLTEMKVVLKVARETYGWSRKKGQIAYREISVATGLDRRTVIRAVRALVMKKVLFLQETSAARAANILGINKNYEHWAGAGRLDLPWFARRGPGEYSTDQSDGAEACGKAVGKYGLDSGCSDTIKVGVVAEASLGGGCSATSASVTPATHLVSAQPLALLGKKGKKEINRLIKARPVKNSEPETKAEKVREVSEILDGFEVFISGDDPRPLVNRFAGMGFEFKRVWAMVCQARSAKNPPGYLVRSLSDPLYQVSDAAWAQASAEERRLVERRGNGQQRGA